MLLHRSTYNLAALSFTRACNNDKVLQGTQLDGTLVWPMCMLMKTYVVG